MARIAIPIYDAFKKYGNLLKGKCGVGHDYSQSSPPPTNILHSTIQDLRASAMTRICCKKIIFEYFCLVLPANMLSR